MSLEFKPLGIVKEIIEACGTNISYMYDDLIFIEHNPYMVQFSDSGEREFYVFFNENIESEPCAELKLKMVAEGKLREFKVIFKGYYKMVPDEEKEEFKIEFVKNPIA